MLRLEFILSLPDLLHLGFTASPQNFARSGFSLSILYPMRLGFLLPIQSFAHLGSAASVLDLLHLGLSASAQSTTCTAFSFPLLTRTATDSPVFVSDFLHPEPLILLQSHSQLGLFLSILDFARCGSLLLLQAAARVALTPSVSGLTRLGSVFFLSVIDVTTFDSFFSIRSFVCLGFFMSTLDSLHLDSNLLLRSPCHPESAFFCLWYSQVGFNIAATGTFKSGFVLTIALHVSLWLSIVCTWNFLRLDFMLPLHSFTQSEPPFSVFGIVEMGTIHAFIGTFDPGSAFASA